MVSPPPPLLPVFVIVIHGQHTVRDPNRTEQNSVLRLVHFFCDNRGKIPTPGVLRGSIERGPIHRTQRTEISGTRKTGYLKSTFPSWGRLSCDLDPLSLSVVPILVRSGLPGQGVHWVREEVSVRKSERHGNDTERHGTTWTPRKSPVKDSNTDTILDRTQRLELSHGVYCRKITNRINSDLSIGVI